MVLFLRERKMLRFSRKVEYALIALFYVESQKGRAVSAGEIGKTFCLSTDLLGKVLQALKRAGILDSNRGVKGGYTLLKEFREIPVYDVVKAVDKPILLVDCADEAQGCAQAPHCNIRNPMMALHHKLVQFFSLLTLEDLKKESHLVLEKVPIVEG